MRLLRLSTWDRIFTNTNIFAKDFIIIKMLRHLGPEIVFYTRHIEQRGPCGHSAAITGAALQSLCTAITRSAAALALLCSSLLIVHSIVQRSFAQFVRNTLSFDNARHFYSTSFAARTIRSCRSLFEVSEISISFCFPLCTCLSRGGRDACDDSTLLSLDLIAHE